jgi:hypothetical protein
MQIKGMTEVVRLPRLGKIRLGIKKENASGVSYPFQTEYFVCPEEVRKIFGEKSRELKIMFPTEEKKVCLAVEGITEQQAQQEGKMFQRIRILRFIGIIGPPRSMVRKEIEMKEKVVNRNPSDEDEKLLDLWARIKSKMWHYEVQNLQIASWFDKNYHLEVGLTDFDPPKPPSFFTIEMLSDFYQALDRYAGRQ